MQAMYEGINNSPQTTLVASISATETSLEVLSAAALPPAPNLATIGIDDDAEVIRYNGIEGDVLTGCERGFNGTLARVWSQGTPLYRAYTNYDQKAFIDNIQELDESKLAENGEGENIAVTFVQATTRANIASKEKLSVLFGKIAKFFADLKDGAFATFGTGTNNVARGDHTHNQYLTAETDPTVPAWAKTENKPSYTAADVGAIPTAQKATANGVASLGSDTKVPTAQLPAASATAAGISKLNDAVNSTATDQSATPNAVKKTYDAAVRQINITGRNLMPANGIVDLGITASATDLTPGVSALATGTIRLVYE